MSNNNNGQVQYAGFWTRWFAEFTDIAIWWSLCFIGVFLLSRFGSGSAVDFIYNALWLAVCVIFIFPLVRTVIHPLLISSLGGGLGKLVFGLQIVRGDGPKLTYKNALFREYLAKIASNALFGLGYYWIFRTEKKQGWHDSLADTYVVKKHNGIITGLAVLTIMLITEFSLVYVSAANFAKNDTLKYDLTTLVTQISQEGADELPVLEDVDTGVSPVVDY